MEGIPVATYLMMITLEDGLETLGDGPPHPEQALNGKWLL